MTRFALVCCLFLAPLARAATPLGINLAEVNYYSTELPSTDYMRSADLWRLNWKYLTADDPRFDAQGWVKAVAPGEVWTSLACYELNAEAYAYLGPSKLIVRYDGSGTLTFDGGYRAVSHDARAKRVVLEPKVVPPTSGVMLKLTATNPANYLRNIRITKPEHENVTDGFDPLFLDRWQGVSVFRFMDWGRTNGSPLATWADRTPPDYFTQAGRRLAAMPSHSTGVSYEAMIALGNRMGKDIWLCIPHQADDAYVTQLALLVKQQLDPERRVYVEHSNEVWNGIFPQYQFCVARAKALGITAGNNGDFGAAMRYHGLRTRQIGQAFDAVLGKDRVTTVLGTMLGVTSATQQALIDAATRNVVDAVAVAYYVDLSSGLKPVSVDEIFADMNAKGLPKAKAQLQAQKIAAGRLPIIAYEGGQHIGFNVADPSLYIAANRDPRMGEFYNRLLTDWFDGGGGVFVAFNSCGKPGKYGSWGLLEGHGQNPRTAPKYQAFQRFAAEPEFGTR
jgi:hypothetical protein